MTDHRRRTHCPHPGCPHGPGTEGHLTNHRLDDRCLPHRAAGHFPAGMATKHDVDEHWRIQDRINPQGWAS